MDDLFAIAFVLLPVNVNGKEPLAILFVNHAQVKVIISSKLLTRRARAIPVLISFTWGVFYSQGSNHFNLSAQKFIEQAENQLCFLLKRIPVHRFQLCNDQAAESFYADFDRWCQRVTR